MDDLIRREDVMALWGKYHPYIAVKAIEFGNALKDIPSASENECEYIVSKGMDRFCEEYKCSVCGDSFSWMKNNMFPNKFNYCRNCGRKIVKFIDESKSD